MLSYLNVYWTGLRSTVVCTEFSHSGLKYTLQFFPSQKKKKREPSRKPPDDGISTLPPAKPKGGEVYLYKPRCDTEKGI